MNKSQKTSLTQNEILALKACLNYADREEQLSDNMSQAGAQEMGEALCWNPQQVGGLISSLTEKGMGEMDEECVNGTPIDLFWLSEKGINAIFDIIENEKTNPPPAEDKTTSEPIKLAGTYGKYAGIETMREAKQALHAKDAEIKKLAGTFGKFAADYLPPGSITDEQLEHARLTGAKIAVLEDTLLRTRGRLEAMNLESWAPYVREQILPDITNALAFTGREPTS